MNDDTPALPQPSPDPGSLGRFRSLWLRTLWGAFAVFWVIMCLKPRYWDTWWTENGLLLILVVLLLATRKRFPLSIVSHALIVLFLALHTVGTHYSYSEVPYNDWFKAVFGRPLSVGRNQYDRLVHFLFGLLLSYPIRELFLRIARVRGFWGYYLPLDVTMSFSMIYELIEWAYAAGFGGHAGQSFLGTQGDQWDAHKDMALATLGAVISMTIVALINWRFDRNFGDEFRQSLRTLEGDGPLGEVRLAQMRRRRAGGEAAENITPGG